MRRRVSLSILMMAFLVLTQPTSGRAQPTQPTSGRAQPAQSTSGAAQSAPVPSKARPILHNDPLILPPVPISLASVDKPFKPFKLVLPPLPSSDHEVNKTLHVGPLGRAAFNRMALGGPIKLEAVYNEGITLEEALNHALRYSLAIKLSRESFNYQKYQMVASAAGFIPSFGLNWSLNHADILPDPTVANSRLYTVTVSYPVFSGGSLVYGTLAQYYRNQSFYEAYKASINDALLDVYKKYTNLVLNECLLQIRNNSLELSETQLKMNNELYESGTGTQFAIMQSRTQLGADRQAAIKQQQATRRAAIDLAFALNLPLGVNLIPLERTITEGSIVDRKLGIETLIDLAVLYRPELRQYEFFRLAAARSVQQAAASLYPSLSFFTGYTHASTTVNPPENSDEVSGIASAQVATGQDTAGLATNTALNQTTSFSPESSNTAEDGSDTSGTVVAGGGGDPIANIQSGGLATSGAVAPSLVGGSVGGGGASNTAGAGVFAGLSNTYQRGFSLGWSQPNMGLSTLFGIVSTRALARQSMLQANQELQLISQQVREAFVIAAIATEKIDASAFGVDSAGDALRLANLRVRTGLGTNLELINAQRDYINALIKQAEAITASNQAQAQLLHDTGVISVAALTKGYRLGDAPPFKRDRKRRI